MFLLFFRLIYSLYFILDISKVYFVELGKYSCVCVCVRESRRNHNLSGILEVGSDKNKCLCTCGHQTTPRRTLFERALSGTHFVWM